jgi:uncharacterized protein (DUF302 family)
MNAEFAYKLETDKAFDDVVAAIEENVPNNQFRVLAVHDVKETLADKGLEYGDLKIIEICNAKFAHTALNKNPDVAMFMPCRYTVRVKDGKTVVSLNRPSMIAEMMPESDLGELAGSVEETLKKIMHESV